MSSFLPPPRGRKLSRRLILRAFRAGRTAGSTGRPVTACPYDLDDAARVEKWLGKAWVRGYTLGAAEVT